MNMHIADIRRNLESVSLRYKLIAIMLFNSIAITVCAVFGYQIYTKAYNQLLFNSIAGNLSLTSYKISEKLENIETLSSMMLSSPSIQDTLSSLTSAKNDIEKSEDNKLLNTVLSDYYASFRSNGIAYLTLYNHQFANCTNWAYLNKTPRELIEAAREQGVKNQGAITWTYYSRDDYMVLSRNIRQIRNMAFDPIGELMIGVDMDKIVTDATRSLSMYEDLQYIITDQNDRIIYATDTLTDEDALHFLSELTDTYETVSYKGHEYFAVWGTLPHYEYKYITLAPYDEIADSLHLSLRLIVIIFAVGFLLILFLSNHLIQGIVRQFDALIHKMQAFTQNELVLPDQKDGYGSKNDEIGKLHSQFDSMAQRIQTLVKVNYVNEILTKDARLKALKSQINPHFLYNTLETINWRAKAVGNDKISQMVESLGALLRATLSNKTSLVTLSYELELVESYMTIQKIRFEERLAYEVDVAEELYQAVIPPLTIQPLVENAIHYGMEEMTDVCHIFLQARSEDHLLTVAVKNEGSYFEDHLLEKLRANKKVPNGFGIGLLNIDQRIKLLFGDSYGLSLSNEGGFAVASITLPYQVED